MTRTASGSTQVSGSGRPGTWTEVYWVASTALLTLWREADVPQRLCAARYQLPARSAQVSSGRPAASLEVASTSLVGLPPQVPW